MLNTIKDNFAGYLTIFGLECFFAFSNSYSLKIIPKKEDVELLSAKCKERGYNFDSLGWIHAVDDWGYDVAFLLSEKQMLMCYHNDSLTLITDIVLQTSNSKDRDGNYLYDYIDLNGLTAIDFTGDAVNAVFSPKSVIKRDDIEKGRIEWLPTVKFSKSFSTELNGKKCSLIFTIIVDRQDVDLHNNSLGELHSVIRLEFDERQDVSMIETSWQAVCTFLTFCMGQFNVTDLHIGLWDTKDKIGIRGFQSTIYCQINGDKVEGIQFSFPAYYRFQADFLGDKTGGLFKLLNNKDTRPILSFLPRTNIDNNVDRNKVRDLCTALEVEYEYEKAKFDNSGVDSLICKLKEGVKDYKKENPGILDDSTYDYVCGSLGLISLPAKEKLWRIYNKYGDIIKEDKWAALSLPCIDFSETKTKRDIGWMVKIRNTITHTAEFADAEIPNAIYARLRIAVYCSILERSGYSLQELTEIMKNYFGRLP
jgi:hypothetical protein